MKLPDSSSDLSKDSVIRVKISFNPVGNLQLYSTSLITVNCNYTISLIGFDITDNEKKYFENEIDQLKSKLVGKIFSKPTPKQKVTTCSLSPTNLCKEICEDLQIQITFTLQKNKIRVGEEEKIEVKVKNVGNDIVYLKKIENILSKDFKALETTHGELVENANLNLKRKKLEPSERTDITISFEPLRSGSFEIRPKIFYFDAIGTENVIECHTKVYKVLEASLPGRIPIGYPDLDNFLFGGLPEKYSIILTSPSIDERENIISSYLKSGVDSGEVTFYVTFDSMTGNNLAKNFPETFFLFLANPKVNKDITSLPNVYSIKGVGTLSNISIALTKALRLLDPQSTKTRRICIDIISDVLLEHKAVVTRKWMSALLSDLKSKGFTIFSVLNPLMHPLDQVQAILGLFDGEINISEKQTKDGLENFLRIKRMQNQKYSRGELKLKPDF
jgi:KaiC/GvpD/RAD55 family RecA-like ATPase